VPIARANKPRPVALQRSRVTTPRKGRPSVSRWSATADPVVSLESANLARGHQLGGLSAYVAPPIRCYWGSPEDGFRTRWSPGTDRGI
jgi:hypothetical protein